VAKIEVRVKQEAVKSVLDPEGQSRLEFTKFFSRRIKEVDTGSRESFITGQTGQIFNFIDVSKLAPG
jgi:hypothetical protein